MRIKQEKQLNLPQLIEWATVNDVRDRKFFSKNGYCVGFNRNGIYINSNRTISLDETFTVEVEEEITEDTWFPQLVTRTVKGDYSLWKKGSINSFKHITFNDVEAIYIPNDDLTLTLIWTQEKGLVE